MNVGARGAAGRFRRELASKRRQQEYFLGLGLSPRRESYSYEELFAHSRSMDEDAFRRSHRRWEEIFADRGLPHSALIEVLQPMRGARPLQRTKVANFEEARAFIFSQVPELAAFWRDGAVEWTRLHTAVRQRELLRQIHELRYAQRPLFAISLLVIFTVGLAVGKRLARRREDDATDGPRG